jgi:hypothetical protein
MWDARLSLVPRASNRFIVAETPEGPRMGKTNGLTNNNLFIVSGRGRSPKPGQSIAMVEEADASLS